MKKLSNTCFIVFLFLFKTVQSTNISVPKDSTLSNSAIAINLASMPELKFYKINHDFYLHQWAIYKAGSYKFEKVLLLSLHYNSDTLVYDFRQQIGQYKVCLEPNMPSINTDTICLGFSVTNKRDVMVPSVLTANCHFLTANDSGYHSLKVLNVENYSIYKMEIYNRWGEVVFETNDINDEWCGKNMKGDAICPNGVYFYTLEYGNSEADVKNMRGNITLIADNK